MAICRVYVLTYRRNNLLPRAINSLLSQTFNDWVCELHNDDPSDLFPQKLVSELSDSRIQVVNHNENLGPTRTFNLIFKDVVEPFISLLEDDNWWEPTFLSTMLGAMEQFPNIQVAWANMQLWQEESDGSWTNTNKAIWNRLETDSPQLFNWGQQQQIMGALHSNGAMMVRNQSINRFIVPENTPFSGIEAVRERAFPFPVLFVPQICANFAITRCTSRSHDRSSWSQLQTLLVASFFKHVSTQEPLMQEVWLDSRSKSARSTGILFFAAFICPECRKLLQYASLGDWVFFIAYCIKHPRLAQEILQSIQTFPKVWNFLDRQTASRFEAMESNYL